MNRNQTMKKATSLRIGVALAMLVGMLVPAATAAAATAPITVVNAGFETTVLADGAYTSSVAGWTTSGAAGEFNPTAAQLAAEAAEGSNTAWSSGGTISQVLSATLTEGNTYRLSVQVGDRNDIAFPGYTVELLAGGVVLATTDQTTFPGVVDGWVTAVVEYTALAGDSQLDLPLEIRLSSAGSQTNFDDVQLTGNDPTPVIDLHAVSGTMALPGPTPVTTPVAAVNAGFEDTALADGAWTTSVAGWTTSGAAGEFNPTAAQLAAQAAEGSNTAYSNGGTISQVLSATLTEGNTYRLSVQVGERNDTGFPGYTVELLAGGAVLASTDETTVPGVIDGWVTAVLEYTALAGDSQLDLPLEIRLSSAGTQTNFDDVQLVTFVGPTIPVWGYTTTGAAATRPGGPTLVVNEGDEVTINLHNDLTEVTALLIGGQRMTPDKTGAASGDTKSYTFRATNPGTFLYEAGLLPNAQHQVAMGLYGALIVRPATAGQAYAAATTAYDDEAVLVLSEIDPALNADPAGFDMRDYSPEYFLINGKVYPNTDLIPTVAGNNVLLRYVNAGNQYHSMMVLGSHQTVIAYGGSPLAYSHQVVAETFGPGQTADAIFTVPAGAVDGAKLAVYDGSLLLHNSNTSVTPFGGMLTFLTVTGPPSTGDTTGPAASAMVLDATSVTAVVSDSGLGDSDVTLAEFFIDTTGVNGLGTSMALTPSGPDSVTVDATGTIDPALTGNHTVYVHGMDSAGNWGPFQSALFRSDNSGPLTSALRLFRNPTNGGDVALYATADDRPSGRANIAAAEYWIGADPGVGLGEIMTVTPSGAQIAALTATFSATPLDEGTHVVSVRSQDSENNWGATATIDLIVDKTGPATSNVLAEPHPNNGMLPINSSIAAVRVTATFDDSGNVGSKIVAGEGFIDTVGANGTGFIFLPTDGLFNGVGESGYVDVPLTTINALSDGNHTIYVRGKDAAGNWGTTSSTILTVDKTAPTFTNITVAPSPTNGSPTVTLTVNGAADTGGSLLSGGEYWFGATNPPPGGGTQFSGTSASIDVSALATGTYTVSARIRDGARNWSTISSATLTVWADAIFSNGFESGGRPWGWTSSSTTSTGRLNVTAGAALVGTLGLQAVGNNTNYVQYNFGTPAVPAAPTYDARFYFRPNGNTSTGKDIFSAATTSGFGTTLFRVRYRLNGVQEQVQIQLGTANTNTAWTTINGAASNVIEVVWQAVGSGGPNPGRLQLIVNGTVAQTLTTTSTSSVGAVRLGSVTSTGNNTALYFDAFVSKRQTSPLVGP